MNIKTLLKGIWSQRFLLGLLAVWSLLLAISILWNLHENYKETLEKARVEARTILQHNLAYRRWNSMHGGVYAKVTNENRPNPYIVVGNRDIVTNNGTKYTLINPFQMTKQAYDLLKKQSPHLAAINRTVSENPLNPENLPDAWERKALQAFEEGRDEVNELTYIFGLPYMRLLAPYITEERCLKCHEHQGYNIGDIRGGMSIAVPMQPYYMASFQTRKIIVLTHLALWGLGAGIIILFFIGIGKYKKAIAASEEEFRIVSEFAYNFECWINNKGGISFISPSCERITGYSRDDFYNDPKLLHTMILPDDREIFKNHLCEISDPAHEEIEYRITTKDGETRWLAHSCTPIYEKGEFLGRRGSTRDITDKKRLEDQLFQAQKMECLGHFSGGVAHDFNNVLSSIATFTHLLIDEIEDPNEDLQEYLDHIIIAAKLGRNLTSNLLAFGKKQIARPKILKLNEIIYDVSNLVRSLMSEDIAIKLSLSKEDTSIYADPHQIGQTVINLCTNARDAMLEGGELTIKTNEILFDRPYKGTFSEIPAGDYMVLSVTDTGYGINASDLTHIFEPFFTTKDSCKGTGLGLSIIFNIAKENKAFIDVESALGKGTTFKVYFPTVKEDAPEDFDNSDETDTSNQTSKTILLADDDELTRKSLTILLRRKGYRVIKAEDGEDAIEKYKLYSKLINMVILDVVLPKKNGKEVYDVIKEKNKNIKTLFISGFTNDILTEKGIKEEELNFMSKPLDIEMFASKVQSIIQS